MYLFPEKYTQIFLWAALERWPHPTNGTPYLIHLLVIWLAGNVLQAVKVCPLYRKAGIPLNFFSLIESLLESKTRFFFAKVDQSAQWQNWTFVTPWWPFWIQQAVQCCRRWATTPGATWHLFETRSFRTLRPHHFVLTPAKSLFASLTRIPWHHNLLSGTLKVWEK